LFLGHAGFTAVEVRLVIVGIARFGCGDTRAPSGAAQWRSCVTEQYSSFEDVVPILALRRSAPNEGNAGLLSELFMAVGIAIAGRVCVGRAFEMSAGPAGD
jgi:hypothetical protein